MKCPTCNRVMESRIGEIDTVPVVISICLACKTSTCDLIGDAMPIFEKVFNEIQEKRRAQDETA